MVLVPLVSLALVEDSVPGSSQVVAGPPETSDDRLGDRSSSPERASRSKARLAALEAINSDPTTTSTTESLPPAPSTTLAPPTTKAPAKAVAKAAAVTTTSAKPKATTTTTAKPKPTTTAKPKPTTTTVPPTTTTTAPPNRQEGGASYYEAPSASTCAHRTIVFGTVVRVTNLANGKRTTCTVNDRGPYIDGRVIDLSPQSFASIAAIEDGVIQVAVEW